MVSIITPTTHDRAEFNERCKRIVSAQTYPNIEHIMLYEQFNTLGEKMNECIKRAKGGIIVNMDSDDIYAPDWTERIVHYLQTSGADVVGLKHGYFDRSGQLLSYTYPIHTTALLGATMAHTKQFWERRKYNPKNVGYDVDFTVKDCKVAVFDYSDGFIATIHSGNVSPKNTTGTSWRTYDDWPTQLIELKKGLN